MVGSERLGKLASFSDIPGSLWSASIVAEFMSITTLRSLLSDKVKFVSIFWKRSSRIGRVGFFYNRRNDRGLYSHFSHNFFAGLGLQSQSKQEKNDYYQQNG